MADANRGRELEAGEVVQLCEEQGRSLSLRDLRQGSLEGAGKPEVHPRLRELAGLELGTGLPVNPVSPEAAVEELLERTGATPAGALA